MVKLDSGYLKCRHCGHEYADYDIAGHIINEKLDPIILKKRNLLDLYKLKILKEVCVSHETLIDFGCASGKFLYQARHYFKKCIGVETTPACIDFARDRLKLSIFTDLDENTHLISCITFWHSLEHLPCEALNHVFEHLKYHTDAESRILVSVPNQSSVMEKLFRTSNPYYDKHSHYHQFTYDSINGLFEKNGFEMTHNFFSLPYSFFGYLQGLMNLCESSHNDFYYWKKRGQADQHFYHYFLLILFFVPAMLLTILDFMLAKNRGVLTLCFRKKR